MSVKPLVKLLRIATADKTKMGLMEQIQESVTDHMNAGVEEIVGQKGRNWFRVGFSWVWSGYTTNFLQNIHYKNAIARVTYRRYFTFYLGPF